MKNLPKSTRRIIAIAILIAVGTVVSSLFLVSSEKESKLHYPLTVISKGERWGETLNNHDPIVVNCLVRVKDRTGDFSTLSGLEYCSLKAGDEIK